MTDEGAAVLPGTDTAAIAFRPRTAYVGFRAFGSGDGAVLLAQGVVRRLRAAAELAAGERRVAGGLLYGRPWGDEQGGYVVVTGFLEAGTGENPDGGSPDDGSPDDGSPDDGAAGFILSQADLRLLRADANRMYSASVEVGWWRTLDQLGEFSPGDFLTQRDLAGPGGAGLLVYGSGPHWGTAYLGPDGAAPDCAGTLVATRRPSAAETAPGFGTDGGRALDPADEAELIDLASGERLALAGSQGAWPEPGDIATATDAEPEDPFVTTTEDGPDDPFVTASADGPDDPFAGPAADGPDDPFTIATGPGPGEPVPAGTGREPRKGFAIASLARERLAQQTAGAPRTRRLQTGPSPAKPAPTEPQPTVSPRAVQPQAALPQTGAPAGASPEAGSLAAGPAEAGAAGAGPGTVVATRRRGVLTSAPRPTEPRVISPMRVSTDEWRVKRPHPGNVGPETPTDVKLVVGGLIVAFIIVAIIIGVLFSNALIAVVAGVVFMLVVFGFVWMSRL